DGTSTSAAKVTLTDTRGRGIPGQTVVLSSTDAGEQISAVVDHSDGTYTATITSSTTAGTPTITATDTSVTPHVSAQLMLTQHGPAAGVAVVLNPTSIVGNSSTTSTATATVTDAHGIPVAGDPVVFTSSDAGQVIGPTTDNGDGTYTATVR